MEEAIHKGKMLIVDKHVKYVTSQIPKDFRFRVKQTSPPYWLESEHTLSFARMRKNGKSYLQETEVILVYSFQRAMKCQDFICACPLASNFTSKNLSDSKTNTRTQTHRKQDFFFFWFTGYHHNNFFKSHNALNISDNKWKHSSTMH